jgi:hypothetical protein
VAARNKQSTTAWGAALIMALLRRRRLVECDALSCRRTDLLLGDDRVLPRFASPRFGTRRAATRAHRARSGYAELFTTSDMTAGPMRLA